MFRNLWKKLKDFLFRNTYDYQKINAGVEVKKPTPETRPSMDEVKAETPVVDQTPFPLPTLSEIPENYLNRALEITGSFEGVGFGQVTGDHDDQGMSCGVLQWCYGQGSLQAKLLKPYILKHGQNKLNSYFNINVAQTAYMNAKEACSFARKHMLIGKNVKPEFKQAWINLLLSPEMKELQVLGCGDVAKRAWNLCKEWDLKSMKAFCFFFDVLTQNGSIKVEKPVSTEFDRKRAMADAPASCIKTWKEQLAKADLEGQILFIAAHKRSLLARKEYFNDVFSRKGTIALGKGYVHGSFRDFTEIFEGK